MRGKQRFEVIDPVTLAPRPTQQPAEHESTSVAGHTRMAQETITADCWWGECDCEGADPCPTTVLDICVECSAEREDWYGEEGGVELWPCPKSSSSEGSAS